MNSRGKKGFTLMELLIVVAIIAILIVISIPLFSGALDKAKIAADDANMRAAKAVYALTEMTTGAPPPYNWIFNNETGKFYDPNSLNFPEKLKKGYKQSPVKDYVISVDASGELIWRIVSTTELNL